MQLSVKGQQIDVGTAFRGHMEDSLARMLSKYFGDAIDARVTLSRTGHNFRAVVSAHVGRNIHLEAHGEADQPYPAFDAAAERLSKRLRRHKRRLKNHRSAVTSAEEDDVDSAPMRVYAGASQLMDDSVDDEDDVLPVVAELSYDIEVLTVEQAVMRLELSSLSMLMFRNASHFGLNVVHLRDDGSIGWIDPRGARSLG